MAEVTIPNSPVHQDTVLTGVYGQTGSYWKTCGYHTGTDFARYGYTTLPVVYAVESGTYIKSEWTGVLGNQVVIQDSSGMYWRYCHLDSVYPIASGTSIDRSTALGVMGQTGSGAHGVHLHLEYSTSEYWGCAYFENPSTALGIPNVSGTVVHYDGSTPPGPTPPPPPPPGPDTPTGSLVHRQFNSNWYWSTLTGYTAEIPDGSQKKENAKYIWNYLKTNNWTLESASVVIGAMDLVSTLNSGWKPTTDDESPFGLLGWRYWEFKDWVDAFGEWVADSDYTVIDNSIGRICWYRQYDLAWSDIGMTLQQFSESKDRLEVLSQSWIDNYAYNTVAYDYLLQRSKYWFKYLSGSNHWKDLYRKTYTIID